MHSMLLCRSWSSRRVINGAWVQGHQPQSVYNEHFFEPSGTTSNHQPNRNKSAEGTGWTILVLRGKKPTSVWWTKSATKHAVKLLRAMLPLTELLCEFPSEKKQCRPISCRPCKCYSTRLGESWYSIVSIPCIARTSLVLGSFWVLSEMLTARPTILDPQHPDATRPEFKVGPLSILIVIDRNRWKLNNHKSI